MSPRIGPQKECGLEEPVLKFVSPCSAQRRSFLFVSEDINPPLLLGTSLLCNKNTLLELLSVSHSTETKLVLTCWSFRYGWIHLFLKTTEHPSFPDPARKSHLILTLQSWRCCKTNYFSHEASASFCFKKSTFDLKTDHILSCACHCQTLNPGQNPMTM